MADVDWPDEVPIKTCSYKILGSALTFTSPFSGRVSTQRRAGARLGLTITTPYLRRGEGGRRLLAMMAALAGQEHRLLLAPPDVHHYSAGRTSYLAAAEIAAGASSARLARSLRATMEAHVGRFFCFNVGSQEYETKILTSVATAPVNRIECGFFPAARKKPAGAVGSQTLRFGDSRGASRWILASQEWASPDEVGPDIPPATIELLEHF